MKSPLLPLLLALVLASSVAACGGSDGASTVGGSETAATETGGLTPAQLENGVGPVTSVELGDIDQALVDQGAEIFGQKCSACHKLDQRYVGPPLGDVLTTRTPAYVMNMMLNPAEMLEKHPEAKEMLAKYMTLMPNQSLTEADARAILEYLRANQQPVTQ